MKFFTVAEAAQILRVTEKSVRDFILSGDLRASKIGQWKIQEDDLVAFVRSRSNSEVEQFLRERKPKKLGEIIGYLVLDYYTEDPAPIAKQMTTFINSAGADSITWNYDYDKDIKRARFVSSGEPPFLKGLLDVIVEGQNPERSHG
jgi:excisionase family DNA binding protein